MSAVTAQPAGGGRGRRSSGSGKKDKDGAAPTGSQEIEMDLKDGETNQETVPVEPIVPGSNFAGSSSHSQMDLVHHQAALGLKLPPMDVPPRDITQEIMDRHSRDLVDSTELLFKERAPVLVALSEALTEVRARTDSVAWKQSLRLCRLFVTEPNDYLLCQVYRDPRMAQANAWDHVSQQHIEQEFMLPGERIVYGRSITFREVLMTPIGANFMPSRKTSTLKIGGECVVTNMRVLFIDSSFHAGTYLPWNVAILQCDVMFHDALISLNYLPRLGTSMTFKNTVGVERKDAVPRNKNEISAYVVERAVRQRVWYYPITLDNVTHVSLGVDRRVKRAGEAYAAHDSCWGRCCTSCVCLLVSVASYSHSRFAHVVLSVWFSVMLNGSPAFSARKIPTCHRTRSIFPRMRPHGTSGTISRSSLKVLDLLRRFCLQTATLIH